MPQHRSRLRIAGHWIWIIVVFIFVLEASARIDDAVRWGAPVFGRYAHELIQVQDSAGVRNRPGFRFEKWAINSSGFRGPDIARTPPAGRLRLGVLGASETFGLFEQEGMEFPAQLGAKLEALYPGDFEVVNFGVAAMSMRAALHYYTSAVSAYEPHIVLFYPTPSFYLITQTPMAADIGAGPSEASVSLLRIKAKTRRLVKEFVPLEIQLAANNAIRHRARSRHGAEWVWTDVPRDRLDLFEKDLDDLVRTIQGTGTDVVLLTHVNRFVGGAVTREDRFHLSAVAKLFPRASDEVLVAIDSASNHRVRRVAAERGAAIIDLEVLLPSGPRYFADYSHFTDEGARLVADRLAHAIPAIAALSRPRIDRAIMDVYVEGADISLTASSNARTVEMSAYDRCLASRRQFSRTDDECLR
jgi:hypothetical protein